MRKFMFLFLGFAMIACSEIAYKEPQPKGIKSLSKIPDKFQGKYLMDNDTVYFFDKGLRGKDEGKEEFLYLSDSIVLKEYKKLYFFSYRDENVWLLRILKQKENGDLVFLEMENVPDDEAKKKIFIENLSKEVKVIQTEGHYIIEPSPRKLHRLIKKGFFKETERAWLKKIN